MIIRYLDPWGRVSCKAPSSSIPSSGFYILLSRSSAINWAFK